MNHIKKNIGIVKNLGRLALRKEGVNKKVFNDKINIPEPNNQRLQYFKQPEIKINYTNTPKRKTIKSNKINNSIYNVLKNAAHIPSSEHKSIKRSKSIKNIRSSKSSPSSTNNKKPTSLYEYLKYMLNPSNDSINKKELIKDYLNSTNYPKYIKYIKGNIKNNELYDKNYKYIHEYLENFGMLKYEKHIVDYINKKNIMLDLNAIRPILTHYIDIRDKENYESVEEIENYFNKLYDENYKYIHKYLENFGMLKYEKHIVDYINKKNIMLDLNAIKYILKKYIDIGNMANYESKKEIENFLDIEFSDYYSKMNYNKYISKSDLEVKDVYDNIISDPVIFKNSKEHMTYIDKKYKEYIYNENKLDILDAIHLYQYIFDGYINGTLRNNTKLKNISNIKIIDFFNAIIKTLDEYYKNSAQRITKKMVDSGENIIYRGESGLCDNGSCRTGKLHGFTSSTIDINIASSFAKNNNCCIYKYILPEGMPYIDVNNVLDNSLKNFNKHVKNIYPHEKEYILPRGISVSNSIKEIEPTKYLNNSIRTFEINVIYDEDYIKNNPIE